MYVRYVLCTVIAHVTSRVLLCACFCPAGKSPRRSHVDTVYDRPARVTVFGAANTALGCRSTSVPSLPTGTIACASSPAPTLMMPDAGSFTGSAASNVIVSLPAAPPASIVSVAKPPRWLCPSTVNVELILPKFMALGVLFSAVTETVILPAGSYETDSKASFSPSYQAVLLNATVCPDAAGLDAPAPVGGPSPAAVPFAA